MRRIGRVWLAMTAVFSIAAAQAPVGAVPVEQEIQQLKTSDAALWVHMFKLREQSKWPELAALCKETLKKYPDVAVCKFWWFDAAYNLRDKKDIKAALDSMSPQIDGKWYWYYDWLYALLIRDDKRAVAALVKIPDEVWTGEQAQTCSRIDTFERVGDKARVMKTLARFGVSESESEWLVTLGQTGDRLASAKMLKRLGSDHGWLRHVLVDRFLTKIPIELLGGDGLYQLVTYYKAIGAPEKAVALNEFVLAADFVNPMDAAAATDMLISLGRAQYAAKRLQALIRTSLRPAPLYCALGECYFAMGQTELASNAYQHAVQMEPNLASPHFGLARVRSKTGDNAGALHEMDETIKREDDQVFRVKRMELHRKLGHTSLALNDCIEILVRANGAHKLPTLLTMASIERDRNSIAGELDAVAFACVVKPDDEKLYKLFKESLAKARKNTFSDARIARYTAEVDAARAALQKTERDKDEALQKDKLSKQDKLAVSICIYGTKARMHELWGEATQSKLHAAITSALVKRKARRDERVTAGPS